MNSPHADLPILTIAIPYYSGLNYLRSAIESVLRQTCTNWQCIVIDDCGGESAEQLIQEFNSEKITYFRNDKTLGLSSNWNRAVDLAETELITIFHADDLMGELFIENTLETFRNNPKIAASHCRAHLIDAEDKKVASIGQIIKNLVRVCLREEFPILKGDRGLRSITLADWIICPTLTYRTQTLKDLRFNNSLNFACDLELIAQLLFSDLIISSRNEYDYSYRVHHDNQTARMKNSGQRFQEEWLVISWIGEIAKYRGWKKTRFVASFKPILRAHIVVEGILNLFKGNSKIAIQLLWWAVYKPPTSQILFNPEQRQKL
jgi:glycosyltransferase involved in cell wall biosynthesis